MKINLIPAGELQVNCYLVYDEKLNGFVVDPGGSFEKIKDAIAKNGVNVKAILLTHGHFDHIGAVKELREYTGAKVYIHTDDADRLTDISKSGSVKFGIKSYEQGEADVLLEGGETITIGDFKIDVMNAKGHTEGCVNYITENAMFSGDVLFKQDIGRTDLAGGNHKEMLRTIGLIKKLKPNYQVLPGHGDTSDLDFEKLYNPYFN